MRFALSQSLRGAPVAAVGAMGDAAAGRGAGSRPPAGRSG